MCAYWAVDTQLWATSKDWLFGVYLTTKKKSAPWRANFREPRSTALYPNPRYNEARYKEDRLYFLNVSFNNNSQYQNKIIPPNINSYLVVCRHVVV